MKKTEYAMEAASHLRKLAATANSEQAKILYAVAKYIETAPQIHCRRLNEHFSKFLGLHPFPAEVYFATDDQGVMLPFPSVFVTVENMEGWIVGIMARHLSHEILSASVFVKPPEGEWLYLPIVYVFSIGQPAGRRKKEIKELLPPALSRHPITDITFQFHSSRGIVDFPLSIEAASFHPVVYEQVHDAFEDFYQLLFDLRQPEYFLYPMEDSPDSAFQLHDLPEDIFEAYSLDENLMYNWLCDEEAYETVRKQKACVVCGAKGGTIAGGAIITEPLGVKVGYGVCGRCILEADYYGKVLAGAKVVSSRISSTRGHA